MIVGRASCCRDGSRIKLDHHRNRELSLEECVFGLLKLSLSLV